MSTDDFEMRSYDEPEAPILEDLRRKSRWGYAIGCTLVFSPIVVILIVAATSYALIVSIFIPLIIVSLVLMMVGLVLVVLYGAVSSSLTKAYKILKRLGPPNPIIGNRYVLKEHNGAYIMAKAFSNTISFIAFRGETGLMSASKIKVPGTFYIWERKAVAGGVKLYRREGIFAVPTERGEIVSGEGVLYADSYVPGRYNWVVPEFTKEQMLDIIEKVTKDAKSQGYEQGF